MFDCERAEVNACVEQMINSAVNDDSSKTDWPTTVFDSGLGYDCKLVRVLRRRRYDQGIVVACCRDGD